MIASLAARYLKAGDRIKQLINIYYFKLTKNRKRRNLNSLAIFTVSEKETRRRKATAEGSTAMTEEELMSLCFAYFEESGAVGDKYRRRTC